MAQGFVPKAGIEPAHPRIHDFESCASTSSATLANTKPAAWGCKYQKSCGLFQNKYGRLSIFNCNLHPRIQWYSFVVNTPPINRICYAN